MKNQVNKKTGLFVLLLAILCLCAAALGVTAFTQQSVAYAQTAELYTAPLAYEYVAAVNEDTAYYKVMGVDVTAMRETGGSWKTEWDTTQRNNISIEIPAVYNDNSNGEAPVKIINAQAFDKDGNKNADFDFKALDLRNADNLEIIEGYAFRKANIDGELYIPSSIKKLGNRAFYASKIKSIVFGDDIGEMEFSLGVFEGITLDNKEIAIPAFFKPIQISQVSGAKIFYMVNIFYGLNGIREFIVNEANATFYAEDGVLFARDNNSVYLFSYPSGKEGETYIVPADVTDLAQRLFFNNTKLKLIVCPATLKRIDAYAFSFTALNVFLDLPSEMTISKTYAFSNHSGKIIVPNEIARTAALGAGGVLHGAAGVQEENVLYLSELTASSKDKIDTSFNAEAVKSNLNVTVTTNGDSPISVPLSYISDFTVTLPDGGLIGGDNTINVACKWLSKNVIINVDKITPTAPAAPTLSGTPTTSSITLTAIEGAQYSMDGGANWQDSPTFTGLAANTEYTFIARIKETSAAHASAASVALTVRTDKITPTAPAAPTLSGTPTSSSITLTAIEGAQYSMDGGANWQDSPTFTGLAANTEYTFIARIKETSAAHASAASVALTVRTDKITPTAPAAPTLSGTPTSSSITLTAIEGAQYSMDGGSTWQDSPTFTGLAANTEYTFIIRIKATDTAHASAASIALTVRTDKKGLAGGAIAGIVIGSILLVTLLTLLALFIFRKNKSQGFKAYYVALGGTCAAAVKGCCCKIKGLFSKNKAENNAITLPKDSSADQDAEEEPKDDATEEPHEDITEKTNDDAESEQ